MISTTSFDIVPSTEQTFDTEMQQQEERIRRMTVSQTELMKQELVKFDQKHETLLDYFAILGSDNGQIRKLIREILEDEHFKGSEYYADGKVPHAESRGFYRVLKPSVLERFPQIDRHKIDFPAYVHDYFFRDSMKGHKETVLTRQQMEEEKRAEIEILTQQGQTDPEEGYQSHAYVDMHARHAYITTHIFYEDLRNMQDSLPPRDIYEMLSTKDDDDELSNFEDENED